MLFLVGDIGGTKTLLAIYRVVGKTVECVRQEKFQSRDHASLEEVIDLFLEKEKIQKACFGIAGPIVDQVCKTTNLPWVVSSKKISSRFKIPKVSLINDLTAHAYGLQGLTKKELVVLNKGKAEKRGNQCFVAAGTGLGEAPIFFDGKSLIPSGSEGGHADFAPRNEREVELFFYLRKQFGHVSYERVLSGRGLIHLYQFLIDQGYYKEKALVKKEGAEGDLAAVITEFGKSGKCPACKEAIRWFCSLYGAEAGNFALKVLAIGGVFIGGGVAPKMIEEMRSGEFMEAFIDKGSFSPLLKKIPVYVVMDANTALKGAVNFLKNQR